jgi:transcriptional regulator with XRE-family HTH domain
LEVGMSLRELARRVDVSASSVSQIETGRTQPSVRTLYAIVSELGLSLDEIFELVGPAEMPATRVAPSTASRRTVGHHERADAAPVCRSDVQRVIELASGVRWERMTTWHDPDVDFMIAIYPPGSNSSRVSDHIRHGGREFGLVIAGVLNVTIGRDTHLLRPGDAITFHSSTPHRLHNDGAVEVRAVWVTFGRTGPRRWHV